jgi:hypothetical protein
MTILNKPTIPGNYHSCLHKMKVYRARIFLWLQSFDIARAGIFARRRSLSEVERSVWFLGFHGIRTSHGMPAPPSNASCIVAKPASSPPPPPEGGGFGAGSGDESSLLSGVSSNE